MLKNITRSLKDILGEEYLNAVKSVAVGLGNLDEAEADFLINEKIEFFPDSYIAKMLCHRNYSTAFSLLQLMSFYNWADFFVNQKNHNRY